MYISTTENNHNLIKKSCKYYFLISLCAWGAATVYVCIKREFNLAYIMYIFLVPLFLGAIPFLFISKLSNAQLPGVVSTKLYNSGIATLTVGYILKAALAVNSLSSRFISVYLYVGTALALIGVTSYLIKLMWLNRNPQDY